jgi:UDP-N-acetylmuramoylalanine--D-glutamate ligase
VVCSFATETPGRIVWFSARRPPNGGGTAFLREGNIVWRQNSVDTKLFAASEIPLRGAHNVANVLAAVAIGGAVGLDGGAMARAVREFTPVPHRIELVGTIDGAAYYNDSIATTPERTLAGLRSFSEPVVLLLGGREKHLPLDELASESRARCRAVVCLGEAGPMLEEALRAASGDAAVERVSTLADAVGASRAHAQPGDVVLLSPACASYDAYESFEQRGDDFRRIIGSFAGKGGTSPSL